MRDYHSSDMGVWWLQKSEQLVNPGHPIHPDLTEKMEKFENYDIYIWRRKSSHQDAEPAVMFYHGGGWMVHSVAMYRTFYSNIAVRNNMTVIAVEYRLSGEGIFPGIN